MSANGWDMNAPAQTTDYGAADTIDLTEDGHNLALPQPRLALPRIQSVAPADAPGPSARAPQRLPRFERNIIDLSDDEDEEEPPQQQTQEWHRHHHVPGHFHLQEDDDDDDDSLFIPQNNHSPVQQARPTTAGLRRPGYMHRPAPAVVSDEIEVVGSRPLSRQPSRRQTPNIFRPEGNPNLANDWANATIDLTADDDDDVIHTDTRPIPGINGDRPAMAGSGIGIRDRPAGLGFGGNMGLGRLAARLRGTNAAAAAAQLARYGNGDNAARAHAAQHNLEVTRRHRLDIQQRLEERAQSQRAAIRRPPGHPFINIGMDYGMVAFDLGLGARPTTPPYEAPKEPGTGFTRSPAEDEEVVCPNCGDELAVGKDELKQQVWVVKACGHVSKASRRHHIESWVPKLTSQQAYCGECATRARTYSSKKGKGKATDPSVPPPLKKCVVVGCEKGATKSQMVHVYMSN